MAQALYEVRRSQMNAKNRAGDDYAPDNRLLGRNRFERRVHSKLKRSVSQLNRIDMNKFFKEDILDINLEVQGETDTYTVRISFGGFLDELYKQLNNFGIIDKLPEQPSKDTMLKCISRALISAYNSENVYIRCSCPDFKYRFAYWLSKDDAIAGEKETRPPTKPWTNPNNTKGSSCKHVAIALANHEWLVSTCNVIRNYINYMEKHYPQLYADVIYPAIYKRDYQEPVQQDMFNTDDLTTNADADIVDTSNKWARTRGRFQKGNEYRFQKQDRRDTIPGQQEFDLDSLADEEETEQ